MIWRGLGKLACYAGRELFVQRTMLLREPPALRKEDMGDRDKLPENPGRSHGQMLSMGGSSGAQSKLTEILR